MSKLARRIFVELAFAQVDKEIVWEGEGVEEVGKDAVSGHILVRIDPRYFRPTEVETLLGDSSKAKTKLGWTPKISFDELVAEMVREDLNSSERDELIKRHGYTPLAYNE